MKAMTDEMIVACYRGGVMVSNGETPLHREKDRIVGNTGMNPASASYYLNAVVALLSNGDIKYDINKTSVDTYLSKIKEDFGEEALIIAASVCLRRFEKTRNLGNACYYYKKLAEKHLNELDLDAGQRAALKVSQTSVGSSAPRKAPSRSLPKVSEWPKWDGPSKEERHALARIITKYVRFLHPQIVEVLTKDNVKHASEWADLLTKCNVDPDQYLWIGSPCCFPGVRRHSGTKEINAFRTRSSEFDGAIALDDNSYPKQIWSYVFRDAGFANFGPDGYQLAHLVDHKDTYGRLAKELVSKSNDAIVAIPGLFSCPTNTAYVPTDFLKPTDFEGSLRNLLQRKAIELYSDVCNPLPLGIHVSETDDQDWNIRDFEWAEPVGTLDYMDDFLRYRREKMSALFNAKL